MVRPPAPGAAGLPHPAEYIGCELFEVAADEYVATHVVLEPAQLPLACPRLGRAVYDDGAFTLVELVRK